MDVSVFDGIKAGISADRSAFLLDFLHNFYNYDVTSGKLVSERVVEDNWNLAAQDLSLAEGEPKYDALERRLAAAPIINVPTITLEGDANGAPHPEPSSYAKKFSGKYEHRTITSGVGHNLPQEAPRAFAEAVEDVDAY